jgi:1-deoxy-D-xylulose-5-phosphate reductoisomerase
MTMVAKKHPIPVKDPLTKTLTILGATGSIGKSTLKIVRHHPERFRITAISANSNVKELVAIAHEFRPKLVAIADESKHAELSLALQGTGISCVAGVSGLIQAAQMESDIVMAAIVGATGLIPALEAIRRGATLALANKECLVCAGSLFMSEVTKHHAQLIPVDSEHNAIHQVFDFASPERVEKITITASGGPFRELSLDDMQRATPEQAVKHPNWSMGSKISVDSATMINKGLEIIEAFHLFPVRKDQIDVLVHPESIIHSMVSFVDGSVLAQMGAPDMCTPIAYALSYPERIPTPSARLNLAEISSLHFYAPDEMRFPALRIAKQVLKAEGIAPCIMNAANEIAVEAFLKSQLRFTDITNVIEATLDAREQQTPHSIEDILDADREARHTARQIITQKFS